MNAPANPLNRHDLRPAATLCLALLAFLLTWLPAGYVHASEISLPATDPGGQVTLPLEEYQRLR